MVQIKKYENTDIPEAHDNFPSRKAQAQLKSNPLWHGAMVPLPSGRAQGYFGNLLKAMRNLLKIPRTPISRLVAETPEILKPDSTTSHFTPTSISRYTGTRLQSQALASPPGT
jgi:hypothetical protein